MTVWIVRAVRPNEPVNDFYLFKTKESATTYLDRLCEEPEEADSYFSLWPEQVRAA